MFRRRSRKPLLGQARDFLWPRTGWRRAGTYFAHRLARLPGSAHGIAAGFSCGVAVSFTPLLGLQTLLALLLAWVLRGNVAASALGTVTGNPWTFPLIWMGIYRLGASLLRLPEDSLPDHLTLSYLLAHPASVLLPMSVGAVPASVAAWVFSYWPIRRLVAATQARRRARINQAAKENRA